MRRKRVSVICPTCEKRYQRVPRQSEFDMTHYGVCRQHNPMVGVVPIASWKEIKKGWTWRQVIEHTINRCRRQAQDDILRAYMLTEKLRQRGRLSWGAKETKTERSAQGASGSTEDN